MRINRGIMCLPLLTVLLVMITGTAIADDVNVELVAHFGGVINAVDVVDNYAYIGQGQDVVILDISNPFSPVPLGKVVTDGFVEDIEISGNYAYVSELDDGIVIIDVSNPFSLTITGSCDTPSDAGVINVSGNYAYVASGQSGLVIVDVTDPYSPILAGSYDVGEYAVDVSVSGNYAYVIDGDCLVIVNVTDPYSPILAGSYDVGEYSSDVSVSGNYAYFSNSNGFVIVDVTDPYFPTFVGSYDTGEYVDSVSLCVSGNYAYVADGYHGRLVIVDVTEPSSPTSAGIYDTVGFSYSASVFGNYAYIAESENGLVIVDVTYPYDPIFIASCDTGEYATSVFVSGNYAYVIDGDCLVIVDVTDPTFPILRSSYDIGGFVSSVSVSGNYAYVTDQDNGLVIVDISNPSSPVLAGSYNTNTNGFASSVFISGNYAYLTETDNGLLIIDISDPFSPILVGTCDTGGSASDVFVSGNYAYVAAGNGLVIVDVIDSSSPTIVGSYYTVGGAQSVSVSDNYAYVADANNGFVILQTGIQDQKPIDGSLVKAQDNSEVYILENGEKRHFTSPEALEWNGYNFSDVIEVSSETLASLPNGADISISQAIIDKYYALGGSATFGQPVGTGELDGEPDSAGNYCSYVNFQNGAIDCFKNGPHMGETYAILNPLFTKWGEMGYGAGILGYPISDISENQYSKYNTSFKYQNFVNGDEKGALEYNVSSGEVVEIHGAIFAKWSAMGYADSDLGLVTSDERDAVTSFEGTTGRVSDFENGHLHWHSSGDHYMGTYMTYGEVDDLYIKIRGTASDLGFPIMDQEEINGHGYCEFEGGKIEWDDSTGTYKTVLSAPPTVTYAYVTNMASDTVSVIDTTTNAIAATVKVGEEPQEVVVNPEGTKVYVANRGSNTVSVIDTATNTVTATVNVGSNPEGGIAVNPEGTKVYVANRSGWTISIIDTATNTVTAALNVGHNPLGFAVNPEGTKVYVANSWNSNISVIDIETNTVIAKVNLGNSQPFEVGINPTGTYVYALNADFTVSVIDTVTNLVATTIDLRSVDTGRGDYRTISPSGFAVNPNGTKVYITGYIMNVGHEKDIIAVIDTKSNIVTTAVYVGLEPREVAVNPEGTKIYVANAGSNTVSVIDTATNTVTATVSVGRYPSGVAMIPSLTPVLPITVGQNATTPEITQKFIEACDRNGGLSVLGNPTKEVHYAFGFEVQDFPEMPATNGGVIMYNPNNKTAYFIHGAIWDRYYAYPDADKARLGAVASDEKDAIASPKGTVGRYTEFETGAIHWISDKTDENAGHSQRGQSFATYGDLNKIYDEMGGTGSELGFPIMDQETKADGHDYCEFEGGSISWDSSTGAYKTKLNSEGSLTTLTIEFFSAQEGDSFKNGDPITFSGNIKGGSSPYIYNWMIDGLGTSTMYSEFTTNQLSPGEHTVKLQVSDSQGNTVESELVHFKVFTKKIVIIPAKFSGTTTTSIVPIEDLKKKADLVVDYYSDQSYRKEYIAYDIIRSENTDGWFTLLRNSEDFENSNFKLPYWEEALNLAGVDYNIEYVYENDKRVPNLIDVSEYDTAVVAFPVDFTSQAIQEYVIVKASGSYGEWAHELGHSLYSLKDKGGSEPTEGDVGYWGLMGMGWELNPPTPIIGFDRNIIGWLDYNEISELNIGDSGSEYTMSYLDDDALHEEKLLRLNVFDPTLKPFTNYYIFEARRKYDGVMAEPSRDERYTLYHGSNKGIVIYNVETLRNMIWREVNIGNIDNKVTIAPGESKFLGLGLIKATCLSDGDKMRLKIEHTMLAKMKTYSIITTIRPLSNIVNFSPNESNLDTDLHVITDDGRRIGINYTNNIYYNEIEGALTSGDLLGGGPEWITVPQNVNVTAYVTLSPDLKTMLEGNSSASVEVNTTFIGFDGNGNSTQSEPITIKINSTNLKDQYQIPLINSNSPTSVTNIQSTKGTAWINWTWVNPIDPYFDHTEIYLDGIFQTNTSAEFFNATGLEPETSYTISTRTVDISGNVNETWINSTVTTSAELASDVEKPIIQSVVLFPANTTAGSTINITVDATDNIDVTGVTASDIQFIKTEGLWQGSIIAPASIGNYSLLITAKDADGNTAETTKNYKVVTPTGSLGVGIAPKTTTAPTSGKTIDYTVKIKSIQNFDDIVRVNVTMDGLPASYQISSDWFEWNNQTINIPSNSTVSLPLKLIIPPGQAAGRKAFKVRANSTLWITSAYDSGVITIS